MKSITKFSFLFIVLALWGCKTDSKSNIDIENLSEEELVEERFDSEEVKEATEEMKTILMEEEEPKNFKQVESNVDVKLDEVKIDVAAEAAKKDSILKAELAKSKNLGKSCDDILKDFEELVKKSLAAPDDMVIVKKLVSFKTDLVFVKCKKDESFSKKIMVLEDKLNEDEDDDY